MANDIRCFRASLTRHPRVSQRQDEGRERGPFESVEITARQKRSDEQRDEGRAQTIDQHPGSVSRSSERRAQIHREALRIERGPSRVEGLQDRHRHAHPETDRHARRVVG